MLLHIGSVHHKASKRHHSGPSHRAAPALPLPRLLARDEKTVKKCVTAEEFAHCIALRTKVAERKGTPAEPQKILQLKSFPASFPKVAVLGVIV